MNRSEKSKLKTSLALKGRHTSSTSEFKKGHKGHWWEDPQYRKIMREVCKGEKCYLWRGGCYEPYSEDFNEELKEQIRDKDNDKKNDEPYNLISLCRSCHAKVSHDPAKVMGVAVANIAKVKGVA